jgi:hypothetical protein
VEETIKKVISIDKDADKYRRISDEILMKKRKELQTEMKNMMEENLRSIDAERKRISEDEMRKAEDQILKIKANEEEKINRFTTVFSGIKSEIVETTFNKLINSLQDV